jgi:hypothetical protein
MRRVPRSRSGIGREGRKLMFELSLCLNDAKLLRDIIKWRIDYIRKSSLHNTPERAEMLIPLQDLLKEVELNLNKLPQ